MLIDSLKMQKKLLLNTEKIALTFLVLIWISCLIILIIALTDLIPDNIFTEYRLVVGICFIAITGLIKVAYGKLTNQ